MRFRATVAYDGTSYQGWQRQREGVPTVQAAVEQALRTIANRPVGVQAAGRTDSGVHATGQVIAFDLAWRHEINNLQRAINANLPLDVAVEDVAVAPVGFHPRFDAHSRTYEYVIDNRPVRHPLHSRYAWHVARPLDVDRMNRAAELLVGSHDFATFGQPPQGTVTVRRLYRAQWAQQGSRLRFTIEANAFLFRMVRSLVGSLRLVGDGRWTVDAFSAALAAADRTYAGKTAPPQGLTLVAVRYE